METETETKPLDSLLLNLTTISKKHNKNDKPVFGIVDFLEKIKLPNKKISAELRQELEELYEKTARGYKAGRWEYLEEESFIRRMPFEYFRKRLSKEELLMLYKSSFISHNKDVEDFTRGDEDAFFFTKCWLSYHHSRGRSNWNAAVKAYNAVKTLRFELGPDFSIKYDTSSHFNNKGYSKSLRVFLDGEIGIMLYHKGRHVLTMSVDFLQDYKTNKQSVRIQQIQCANKKGNRWLFGLPCHFISYFSKALFNHFTAHKFTVQMIQSRKMVEDIRNMYENNYIYAKNKWDEIRSMPRARLIASYSKDYADRHVLYCYDRVRECEEKIAEFDGRVFQMLKLYSHRIPGVRRIKSDRPGYSVLVPN